MFKNISEPIRVVVTGVGAITGQGPSADDLWEGSKAGRVAIRESLQLPIARPHARGAKPVEP